MAKSSPWRVLVVMLGWVVLASTARAEPVQVFVEDLKIELEGWDEKKAEALGKALASDVQAAIVKNPDYAAMTYENLESQLRKERKAEKLSCSTTDQTCMQRILDNYGCEERLYGTVRQVGEQAQVSLTRFRNDQITPGGAVSAYAKAGAAEITEAATRLALELFSAAPTIVGETPASVSSQAGDKRIAVLELVDQGGGLTPFELEALGEDVRAAALVLQPAGYVVLTRETLVARLSSDELSNASVATNEVEAGRLVGADLVVSGTVGKFAGELSARLKLFDAKAAVLLGQRNSSGADLKALRSSVQTEASLLFKEAGRDASSVAATASVPPFDAQADMAALVASGPAPVVGPTTLERPAAEPGDDGSPATVSMATIPAGSFWMGCNERVDSECQDDEKPGRIVALDAYRIDLHEVTVAEYAACVKAARCSEPGPGVGRTWDDGVLDDRPVNYVDWNQAVAYCEWAGKRLPTEAEWEKAARGIDGRTFPWGEQAPTCDLLVWGAAWNSKPACGRDGVWPVCSKAGGNSPFGLCDMAGNVREWVFDAIGDDTSYETYASLNPVCSAGNSRVQRGGSYVDGVPESTKLRASHRAWTVPSSRDAVLGFRCAQSVH